VPVPVPPHVADKVEQARALRKLVHEQGRLGAVGIIQGERALARLAHETNGGAAHGGWGSRDQADVVSEVPSTWRPD
jgi:hypothetical protein